MLTLIDFSWAKSILAAFISCGGIYLLSQLARDPGKDLQDSLYAQWGGVPSITILRHADRRVDKVTKARLHRRLCSLVEDTTVPSVDSENTDPAAADDVYTAWSTHLRTNTRDQKRFALIFDELVSYGYRRNSLGLRPFSVAVSFCCLVISLLVTALRSRHTHTVEARCWIALAASLLFLLFWSFVVTPNWVRLSADAYAERLVEAADLLYVDTKVGDKDQTGPLP